MSVNKEILVKTKNNKWRLWRNGQWLDTATPGVVAKVSSKNLSVQKAKPVSSVVSGVFSQSSPGSSASGQHVTTFTQAIKKESQDKKETGSESFSATKKARTPRTKTQPHGPVIKAMEKIEPHHSMADVRKIPQAVGPIEEIKLLNITDFRRLNPNPERAIDRIYDKIKLLEDESYERATEGIRAWKQSPVYRSYLSLIRNCLAQGKIIDDYFADRQNTSELTRDEFQAIIALNNKLRG